MLPHVVHLLKKDDLDKLDDESRRKYYSTLTLDSFNKLQTKKGASGFDLAMEMLPEAERQLFINKLDKVQLLIIAIANTKQHLDFERIKKEFSPLLFSKEPVIINCVSYISPLFYIVCTQPVEIVKKIFHHMFRSVSPQKDAKDSKLDSKSTETLEVSGIFDELITFKDSMLFFSELVYRCSINAAPDVFQVFLSGVSSTKCNEIVGIKDSLGTNLLMYILTFCNLESIRQFVEKLEKKNLPALLLVQNNNGVSGLQKALGHQDLEVAKFMMDLFIKESTDDQLNQSATLQVKEGSNIFNLVMRCPIPEIRKAYFNRLSLNAFQKTALCIDPLTGATGLYLALQNLDAEDRRKYLSCLDSEIVTKAALMLTNTKESCLQLILKYNDPVLTEMYFQKVDNIRVKDVFKSSSPDEYKRNLISPEYKKIMEYAKESDRVFTKILTLKPNVRSTMPLQTLLDTKQAICEQVLNQFSYETLSDVVTVRDEKEVSFLLKNASSQSWPILKNILENVSPFYLITNSGPKQAISLDPKLFQVEIEKNNALSANEKISAITLLRDIHLFTGTPENDLPRFVAFANTHIKKGLKLDLMSWKVILEGTLSKNLSITLAIQDQLYALVGFVNYSLYSSSFVPLQDHKLMYLADAGNAFGRIKNANHLDAFYNQVVGEFFVSFAPNAHFHALLNDEKMPDNKMSENHPDALQIRGKIETSIALSAVDSRKALAAGLVHLNQALIQYNTVTNIPVTEKKSDKDREVKQSVPVLLEAKTQIPVGAHHKLDNVSSPTLKEGRKWSQKQIEAFHRINKERPRRMALWRIQLEEARKREGAFPPRGPDLALLEMKMKEKNPEVSTLKTLERDHNTIQLSTEAESARLLIQSLVIEPSKVIQPLALSELQIQCQEKIEQLMIIATIELPKEWTIILKQLHSYLEDTTLRRYSNSEFYFYVAQLKFAIEYLTHLKTVITLTQITQAHPLTAEEVARRTQFITSQEALRDKLFALLRKQLMREMQTAISPYRTTWLKTIGKCLLPVIQASLPSEINEKRKVMEASLGTLIEDSKPSQPNLPTIKTIQRANQNIAFVTSGLTVPFLIDETRQSLDFEYVLEISHDKEKILTDFKKSVINLLHQVVLSKLAEPQELQQGLGIQFFEISNIAGPKEFFVNNKCGILVGLPIEANGEKGYRLSSDQYISYLAVRILPLSLYKFILYAKYIGLEQAAIEIVSNHLIKVGQPGLSTWINPPSLNIQTKPPLIEKDSKLSMPVVSVSPMFPLLPIGLVAPAGAKAEKDNKEIKLISANADSPVPTEKLLQVIKELAAMPEILDSHTLLSKLESHKRAISTLVLDIKTALPPTQAKMTIETCDVIKEKFYTTLGVLDEDMLVGNHRDIAFYKIHRPNGNIALATRTLSDPKSDDIPSDLPGTSGLGIELIAEAKESDVGDLGNSWLFQMMHETVGSCISIGIQLRQLLDQHGLISMELNNINAPEGYFDPETKRCSVLLGIKNPASLPEYFNMSDKHKVLLVTVRLLTHEQSLLIREYGRAGRRLVADFLSNREKSFHVSSVLPENRAAFVVNPPNPPNGLFAPGVVGAAAIVPAAAAPAAVGGAPVIVPAVVAGVPAAAGGAPAIVPAPAGVPAAVGGAPAIVPAPAAAPVGFPVAGAPVPPPNNPPNPRR